MRIAYFMGSLNRGGAETLALDISRNAKYHNLEPLIIHRRKGNLHDEFLKTDVPIYKLKARSKVDILYIFRIRKILLRHNIEIVHANQIVDAFVAWLACKGTTVKIVMTLHGHYYNQDKKRYLFFKWFIKRLNAVVFVSNSQLEDYRSRKLIPATRSVHCQIIYNGVDLNKIKNSVPTSIEKEINISNNALVLGTVGNFGPGRDQMTICRFLKLLDKEEIDFNFIFIGGKFTNEAWRYDQCVEFIEQSHLDHKVHFLGLRNTLGM